ncbi:hypothetical protein Q3G72_009788 [Acer saccharum]|nr:hypothetical protein Q3G72_009788 [Acer saccharum]
MEIHKCGKDETGKEAMGFPNLITHFCEMAGVDLSAEEKVEPLVDLGIHTWYTLYPSRGLRRPRDTGDIAEMRTKLHLTPYIRKKKTPPAYACPTDGPRVSEEDAVMCIARGL